MTLNYFRTDSTANQSIVITNDYMRNMVFFSEDEIYFFMKHLQLFLLYSVMEVSIFATRMDISKTNSVFF